MEAVGVKYLVRVSEGGEPAMKAEMKAWVWSASGEGEALGSEGWEDIVSDLMYYWACVVVEI